MTAVEKCVLRSPEQYEVIITTTEMHTGGEPLRILESGYPVPRGETILDKIEDLRKNFDQYRRFVILEPHGHLDMYAALLVPPDHPDAHIAVIFLHNEGYSTMCGHACIALGRYAVDRGLVSTTHASDIQVNIQVPCGLVKAFVEVCRAEVPRTARVRFESVPSFVVATDATVEVKGQGQVKVDVAYGGAFYVFVAASDVGVDLNLSPLADIRQAATKVKEAAAKTFTLHHPTTPAFLYGTMVVDSRGPANQDGVSQHVCIFADAETDRSACGSGTTARVALMYHKGHLRLGQSHAFRSGVTGAEFTARALRTEQVGEYGAVVVQVQGQGYYTGRTTLALERGDGLGAGFVVR
ncbi:trans-L-3-hydroxyproline dehydratase-like [Physella acuta]|uniref:trans-L-3-hydroxyproline dehydratase-like n=1 Tax=Physella acuta TaxID=109671 RepID=UPI0027DCC1E4|nr:trans-L-3-hydroxyproline dehydratase-like [Physella acuta]XP_059158917.1 trans-L-3-hydroxyproline dehydratase-like [Physella acuta]